MSDVSWTDMPLMQNITQVAKILGFSRPTVYRLIKDGVLPAKKFATDTDIASRTVVLTEDLRRFVEGLPAYKKKPLRPSWHDVTADGEQCVTPLLN